MLRTVNYVSNHSERESISATGECAAAQNMDTQVTTQHKGFSGCFLRRDLVLFPAFFDNSVKQVLACVRVSISVHKLHQVSEHLRW